jgi:putative peptide zinc metalloprotease protein
MTATAEPPATQVEAPAQGALDLGQGVELLGEVHGSGYKEGAALVRRGDGQMVQLGPLMYGLLEAVDGRRDATRVAEVMSEQAGRHLTAEHVTRLAQKLSAQGLLAGTEHRAPPRRNPLLALRWKVLVTDPNLTRRLTQPFTFLFRPWVVWPVVAAFCGVFWFVLFHKGVASATSQAFHSPGLLLLVFALAVASAGFHELGHAAACRYGGATPGGMGMGMYLVWPAFYTDVTDSYRLPRRDRLRVDLGGLYFNALVAVVTLGVWLLVHADALLLLVALQVLQMVKQLSPVIRADGYHILSDATGVPDLYSHMGPTMRRLLPRHRHEPTALRGRARWLVTAWVLIVVPVLLSLSLSAIILLPRLATTAWDSGHHIVDAIPHQDILGLLASLVRLLALLLPVLGSCLVTQKIVRTVGGKARTWSYGRPVRRGVVLAAAGLVLAGLAWAWWPSGQYQPVRPNQNGTIGGMVQLVSQPVEVARPVAAVGQVQLSPGTHLAVSMIPVGGATKAHPAMYVIPGRNGSAPVAILSSSSPDPSKAKGGASPKPIGAGGGVSGAAPGTTTTTSAAPTGATTPAAGTATPAAPTSTTPAAPSSSTTQVTAFPFRLPSKPGPNDSQALAVNTTSGGVKYDVAYSLVTVTGGKNVTETNSAYALANCQSCTTVAVSFQVVLVVGESKIIAPIDAAGALNGNCPACITTAIADQIVVTLKSTPSAQLLKELTDDLKQLNALPALGAGGTPDAIAAAVAAVQKQIDDQLNQSGLPDTPIDTSTTSTSAAPTPTGSGAATTTGSSAPPGSTSATTPSSSAPASPSGAPASPAPSATTPAPTSTSPTAPSTTSTAASPPSTTDTTTTPSTSSTATTTTAPTASAGTATTSTTPTTPAG